LIGSGKVQSRPIHQHRHRPLAIAALRTLLCPAWLAHHRHEFGRGGHVFAFVPVGPAKGLYLVEKVLSGALQRHHGDSCGEAVNRYSSAQSNKPSWGFSHRSLSSVPSR